MLHLQGHDTAPPEAPGAPAERPADALAQKEREVRRLAALLDALPGAFVALDGKGIVRECNPAARELLGEPLRGVLWRDVVGRAFAPRADDGHEVSLHDGRRVNIATCSLRGDPGQILLINDVTETRRLQERVARLERLSAMGEMAASLAHQIRTPLACALLYASNLAGERIDADDRQRFVHRLTARLRHLENLVRDMLVFARDGAYRREELAMKGLFLGLVHTVEMQVSAAGAVLESRYEAGDAVLEASREALVSALRNLVDNALEAGAGRIELACTASEAGTVRLVVRDDGPGIAGEIAERVFEPFFTTRANGTGLGLAVVQAVVGAHGGTIELASAPGAGCEFTVELPAKTRPATPAHASRETHWKRAAR